MSASPPPKFDENDTTNQFISHDLHALQAATRLSDHDTSSLNGHDQRPLTPSQSTVHGLALGPNLLSSSPGNATVTTAERLATIASDASAVAQSAAYHGGPAGSVSMPLGIPMTQAPLLPQQSLVAQAHGHVNHGGHGGGLGRQQVVGIAGVVGKTNPTHNPKLTRLSRACDNCSARKVKCSKEMPCKPCLEHDIECTMDRGVKRRGPPNKTVAGIREKIARTSTDDHVFDSSNSVAGPSTAVAGPSISMAGSSTSMAGPPISMAGPSTSIPSIPGPSSSVFGSTSNMAAQALVSISGNDAVTGGDARLTAESIAPMPLVELLVDDFFTYIHPLCPFPHQPTFRASLVSREDRTNPEFLALLASMMAALVASFPRSARNHIKSQNLALNMYPRAFVMVDKCMTLALEARGHMFAHKSPRTLDDAATSYFLGLAAGYTQQWNFFRRHISDTMCIISELGYHKPKQPGQTPTFGHDASDSDSMRFNHIKDQVGKRIFWCVFLAVRSLYQNGGSYGNLIIPPEIPEQPYPHDPANADDIHIQAYEVIEQGPDTVTLMTGFNVIKRIYMTMNGVTSASLSMGLEYHAWSEQRRVLRDGLDAVKSALDQLPAELDIYHSPEESGENVDVLSLIQSLEYQPPSHPAVHHDHDIRTTVKTQPQMRRLLQLDIQKANIYLAWLATRSYFVELYFVRRHSSHTGYDPAMEQMMANGVDMAPDDDAQETAVLTMMTDERHLILQDLLRALGRIGQRNLEPNGSGLISKIEQVTATLLEDLPGCDPVDPKYKEVLQMLQDVLLRLKKTGTPGSSLDASMSDQDEEEDVNNWASLRDYQMRFTSQGNYA